MLSDGDGRTIEDAARHLGVEPDDLQGGLNLTQAGRLLGMAASTLRSRAIQGLIGHQRVGRGWRFYWWHILNYLDVQEKEPKALAEAMKRIGHTQRRKVKSKKSSIEKAKQYGIRRQASART